MCTVFIRVVLNRILIDIIDIGSYSVRGEGEFQSRGAMTEKTLYPEVLGLMRWKVIN